MAPNRPPKPNPFPVYKIKNLMKSTPNVGPVGLDATVVMAKATQLFIEMLTEEAFLNSKTNEIDYKDVASTVHNEERYLFLRDQIPKKITVKHYKELMEKSKDISDEDQAFYLH